MTSQEAINEIDYMLARNSYNEKRERALRCAVFHLTRAKQRVHEKETIMAVMQLLRSGEIDTDTPNKEILDKVLNTPVQVRDF